MYSCFLVVIKEFYIMLTDVNFIRSRLILKHLCRLFGGYKFDPFCLEITFHGSRNKIKKAAKILDYRSVWYRINWIHEDEKAKPVSITLQFDMISFRRN